MDEGESAGASQPRRGDIVRIGSRAAIVVTEGVATATVVYINGAAAAAPFITKVNAAFWGAVEQVDVIQHAELGAVIGRVSALAMNKLDVGLQVLQTLF